MLPPHSDKGLPSRDGPVHGITERSQKLSVETAISGKVQLHQLRSLVSEKAVSEQADVGSNLHCSAHSCSILLLFAVTPNLASNT